MKPKLTKSEAARLNGKKGGRPKKAPVVAAPVLPPVVGPPAQPVPVPLDNPFDLDPKELLFVEAYCGPARFVATVAYDLAGYAGTGNGRRVNASQVLSRTKVAQAISAKLSVRVQQLRIADDAECLTRVSQRARGDIRKLFPPEHRFAQLPDDVAVTVKSVIPGKFGDRLELYDAHRDDELLLRVMGKLTNRHQVGVTGETGGPVIVKFVDA